MSLHKTSCARCSLCGDDLPWGYRAWWVNGLTICQHCFPEYALRVYEPFQIVCGRDPL